MLCVTCKCFSWHHDIAECCTARLRLFIFDSLSHPLSLNKPEPWKMSFMTWLYMLKCLKYVLSHLCKWLRFCPFKTAQTGHSNSTVSALCDVRQLVEALSDCYVASLLYYQDGQDGQEVTGAHACHHVTETMSQVNPERYFVESEISAASTMNVPRAITIITMFDFESLGGSWKETSQSMGHLQEDTLVLILVGARNFFLSWNRL